MTDENKNEMYLKVQKSGAKHATEDSQGYSFQYFADQECTKPISSPITEEARSDIVVNLVNGDKEGANTDYVFKYDPKYPEQTLLIKKPSNPAMKSNFTIDATSLDGKRITIIDSDTERGLADISLCVTEATSGNTFWCDPQVRNKIRH